MAQRIGVEDWDELTAHLRRFADGAETTVGDERVRIEFGAAHLEVGRDGRVDAGMPLHGFEREGGVAFVFDHEAGALTVEGEGTTYTFRRP